MKNIQRIIPTTTTRLRFPIELSLTLLSPFWDARVSFLLNMGLKKQVGCHLRPLFAGFIPHTKPRELTRLFSSLKTSIWAPALIRRAETGGAFASVVYRGDPDAGAVLILVRTLDGKAVLYRSMRDMDGSRIWHPKGPAGEDDLDGDIRKAMVSDPDLWVIEIEDKQGRHFLTERVED